MGRSRFYFYTMEGKQIEHKLSGATFSGCDAAISFEQSGGWVKRGYESFKGIVFGRDRIMAWNYDKNESYDITIDDIDGFDQVIVKKWCLNEEMTEFFVLTKLENDEKLACDVPLKIYNGLVVKREMKVSNERRKFNMAVANMVELFLNKEISKVELAKMLSDVSNEFYRRSGEKISKAEVIDLVDVIKWNMTTNQSM